MKETKRLKLSEASLKELAKKWVVTEDVTIGYGTTVEYFVVLKHSKIGKDNKIWNFINIYDSNIGNKNTISSFVEIGGATIGNNCKIEGHTYIPRGVKIGNNVFIGPGVRFANDKFPRATTDGWKWTVGKVNVGDNVAAGIGSIILPNVTIGDHTFIAAGSLVTSHLPPNSFAMGWPAHVVSFESLKALNVL